MRPALLLIGLVLAGCAGTEPASDVVMTAPGPQATTTPAPAAAPAAATPAARTTRATRGNTAPPPAPAEPPDVPEEPMTRERASMICWSKYDDGRRKLSLDQRADLVDKCVQATLRGEKVN